jgi:hypothetical protein
MNKAFVSICLASAAALAGCASRAAESPEARLGAIDEQVIDWREIATPTDRERLREWRTAWIEALNKARASGHAPQLASEGVLLQPDARLAWQDPAPGEYLCRTVKIGAKSPGMLDYVTYPEFTCRIRREGGLMSFAKLSGSQRPLGLLLPFADNRMVFLGTLQLGDERRALQYGRDKERDMAGVIERIGEQRWRLVLPYPHFESTIDILEIKPLNAAS